MNNAISSALELHELYGYPIGDPRSPNINVAQGKQYALIDMSVFELEQALENKDTVKTAEALGRLAYSLASAAVAWGIDLGNIFEALHNAAMIKPYVPVDIGKVLAAAKEELEAAGFGDDSWWSVPTVLPEQDIKNPDAWLAKMSEEAAKPHKLRKAMQDIKADFVQDAELVEVEVAEEARDTEPTLEEVAPEDLEGYFTTYGSYNFTCGCERNHSVSATNGSRGGWAKTAHCECMCGKRFDFTFEAVKGKDPEVTCNMSDLGEPGAKW